MDPAARLAAARACVSGSRSARQLVEELRGIALIAAPAPQFLETLLAALRYLKANKKAAEENKAIRQCYQYISWLANARLLREGSATAVVHQLQVDLRDELVPRQLAALQVYAELIVLHPGCSTPGAFGGALSALLDEAGEALSADAVAARTGGGGAAATTALRNVRRTHAAGFFVGPGAFGSLATACGTAAQQHGALRMHLPHGLACGHADIVHASALSLYRAAARSCSAAAAAEDDAAFRLLLRAEMVGRAGTLGGSGGSSGTGSSHRSGGGESSKSWFGGAVSATAARPRAGGGRPVVADPPVSQLQLASILAGALPPEWRPRAWLPSRDGTALPFAAATASPDACTLFLRAAAALSGIDTAAYMRHDTALAAATRSLMAIAARGGEIGAEGATVDAEGGAPHVPSAARSCRLVSRRRLDPLAISMGDAVGTTGDAAALALAGKGRPLPDAFFSALVAGAAVEVEGEARARCNAKRSWDGAEDPLCPGSRNTGREGWDSGGGGGLVGAAASTLGVDPFGITAAAASASSGGGGGAPPDFLLDGTPGDGRTTAPDSLRRAALFSTVPLHLSSWSAPHIPATSPEQEACYGALLRALLDPRPRVALEAARLLAAGGVPRLLVHPPVDPSSAAVLPSGGHFPSLVRSVAVTIRAGVASSNQPLIAAALRVAVSIGAAFSAWEAHALRTLTETWLVAQAHPVSGGALVGEGGAGDAALREEGPARCYYGPDGELLPSVGRAVDAHSPQHLPRFFCGCTEVERVSLLALMPTWGAASNALCDLVDAIMSVRLGALTACSHLISQPVRGGGGGRSAGAMGPPPLPAGAWDHVCHVAAKAAVWCVPALVLAVPSVPPVIIDLSERATLLQRLTGITVAPPSASNASADFAAAIEWLSLSLLPGKSDWLLASITARASLALLSDGCEMLEQGQLWSLWEALGDRAALFRAAPGNPLPLLLSTLPLLWLQRCLGEAPAGSSPSGLALVASRPSLVGTTRRPPPSIDGRKNASQPPLWDAGVTQSEAQRRCPHSLALLRRARAVLEGTSCLPIHAVPLMCSASDAPMIAATCVVLHALHSAAAVLCAYSSGVALFAAAEPPPPSPETVGGVERGRSPVGDGSDSSSRGKSAEAEVEVDLLAIAEPQSSDWLPARPQPARPVSSLQLCQRKPSSASRALFSALFAAARLPPVTSVATSGALACAAQRVLYDLAAAASAALSSGVRARVNPALAVTISGGGRLVPFSYLAPGTGGGAAISLPPPGPGVCVSGIQYALLTGPSSRSGRSKDLLRSTVAADACRTLARILASAAAVTEAMRAAKEEGDSTAPALSQVAKRAGESGDAPPPLRPTPARRSALPPPPHLLPPFARDSAAPPLTFRVRASRERHPAADALAGIVGGGWW